MNYEQYTNWIKTQKFFRTKKQINCPFCQKNVHIYWQSKLNRYQIDCLKCFSLDFYPEEGGVLSLSGPNININCQFPNDYSIVRTRDNKQKIEMDIPDFFNLENFIKRAQTLLFFT